MQQIPLFILLPITMGACLGHSTLKNVFSKKYQKCSADVYLYTLICSLLSALSVVILSGGLGKVSAYTVIIAALYGLTNFFQSYTLAMAFRTGSFSYTTVISSLSTVIPAFSGAIIWSEKLLPQQYVGVLLMVACFILSVKKEEEKQTVQPKWLIYAILVFVSTGLIGVLQKTHQMSEYAAETTGFVVVAFAVASVLSAVMYFLTSAKEQGERVKVSPMIILLFVAAGICTGLNNQINLYLSGAMDSAVFFPLVNGGHLVLVTLLSITVFKEKLTLRQWIGLGVGCASLMCLCIS